MQFYKWLESRTYSHLRNELRELLINYLPLVKSALEKTGLNLEFSDNQLLGYINLVAGFSIPAEPKAMLSYANNLAKLILQRLVREVTEDMVSKNTRKDTAISELLRRDIKVSLTGNLDNLKVVVGIGSQAYDAEEEKELDLDDVLSGHSKELKDMVIRVANQVNIS